MRISRALALAGIASRRKSEEYVRQGLVTVNGEEVMDLGRQVDVERDAICYRGRKLLFHRTVCYLLNKPVGYVTTASDPNAEKTVYQLLPRTLISASLQQREKFTRVFPVGRLDRDSAGLLLFTNDGELANRLMHPRYEIPKCYEVRLERPFEEPDRRRLLRGVRLKDGVARVEKVQARSRKCLRLVLREGRNREVRRIFEALGYHVLSLTRLTLGPLSLSMLDTGAGRYLKDREIHELRKAVGLFDSATPSS